MQLGYKNPMAANSVTRLGKCLTTLECRYLQFSVMYTITSVGSTESGGNFSPRAQMIRDISRLRQTNWS